MMYRIYADRAGTWREMFKTADPYVAAEAFNNATGNDLDAHALRADLVHGVAFERRDPAGVLGLVCADDSLHAPNKVVAS